MRFGLRSTVEFMQPNSAAISALAEPSRLASTVTGGECIVVKRQERTCSGLPVVGQWANGASKPKLLLDGQFEFPGGLWVRRLLQQPAADLSGLTVPRLGIETRLPSKSIEVLPSLLLC
jgi:hypothetical protein